MAEEDAHRSEWARPRELARVSHEIRTGLDSVIGLAELLLTTQLTPEQREMVQEMERSAEALVEVVARAIEAQPIRPTKSAIAAEVPCGAVAGAPHEAKQGHSTSLAWKRPAAPHPLRTREFRILVADDNELNRKVTLRQLSKLGHLADGVDSGGRALEALERIPYQVVLMDCEMPEMDGYEATREIRRRESHRRHTIVIAMTARALSGDRERCMAAGMDDYIAKPVKLDALAAVMRRVLSAILSTADTSPA